jgi:hypothetical protein
MLVKDSRYAQVRRLIGTPQQSRQICGTGPNGSMTLG